MPVNMEIYSKCSEQFFPLDKRDMEEKEESGKNNRKRMFLRRVYLDESYEKIEEFSKKSFVGSFIINGVSHSCNISVEHEEKYLEKEREILSVFSNNDIEWQVLYTPYSRRFFNLYMEGIPENTDLKKLKEIHVNYREYTGNVHENYFLVSNIQEKSILLDKAKEKSIDGVDCTASNGMLISANSVFPTILTAKTLSLISNSTGTSYAIMFLDI